MRIKLNILILLNSIEITQHQFDDGKKIRLIENYAWF